jgi:hypothetical protein
MKRWYSKYYFSITLLAFVLLICAHACKKECADVPPPIIIKDTIKTTDTIIKHVPIIHDYKVVVVIIDGPRFSESFGDTTHLIAPALWTLKEKGVLLNNVFNLGQTNTINGIAATITGNYHELSNSSAAQSPYETFLHAWRYVYDLPPAKAWVIASKDKTAALAGCTACGNYIHASPNTDCGVSGLGTGYRTDSTTYNNTLNILTKQQPEALLVHFKEPDFSGHTGNWQAYLDGLKQASDYTLSIYNHLQTLPFYKDQTYLYVTNDHGRHLDGIADGFVSHGDNCVGCKHITVLGIGPKHPINFIDTTHYSQIDLCRTISHNFDLSMGNANGKVIQSLRVK